MMFKEMFIKNKIFIVSIALSAMIILFTITVGGLLSQPSNENEIKEESTVTQSQQENTSANNEDITDIESTEEVNLELLMEQNADTLGYIEVLGTNISYPVVKGIDNVKYLTTNFEGEYDSKGTVFADMFNGDSLSGPLTILYGHYTLDETFFSQLHRYNELEYFLENPDVVLHTTDGVKNYQIVAAFTNDHYNLLYNRDYSQQEDMQYFLNHILEVDPNANILPEEMSVDDQYLLLSTCMSSSSTEEQRYIVVAKLVS